MTINVITSDDTLTIFDRVVNDFASGDISAVTYTEDLVNSKTGKNKNTIFAKNESGNNGSLVLRLMRGSDDDRFFAGKVSQIEGDFASFVLGNGQLVKRLGDGQGNVIRDVTTLAGISLSRKPDSKTNVDGDTEQGVTIYTFKIANVTRSIQ